MTTATDNTHRALRTIAAALREIDRNFTRLPADLQASIERDLRGLDSLAVERIAAGIDEREAA